MPLILVAIYERWGIFLLDAGVEADEVRIVTRSINMILFLREKNIIEFRM